MPSTRPNAKMVKIRTSRPRMSTDAIARKALKMAGHPDSFQVSHANTFTNIGISSSTVANLLSSFVHSDSLQGAGMFSGNKVFLKNIEYTMHFNCEAITQSTLLVAFPQYIKPLWVTFLVVQTFFSPLQNRTFTETAIIETIVDPVQSKYVSSTNEMYLGKYKILHREDIKLAGIVNSDNVTLLDTFHRPMQTPTGKVGEGQHLFKGSIAINQTIKFQPDNDPSFGLKMIVITGNSVLNSTIWGFDGASQFLMHYTDA